ncbi:hypothetical protein [Ligilactobacillus salivarius]|uniref:hypothetical protein n=1 Tax=Ligilactobacillus salivarius TaxID=1624 RepID=UPI0031FEFD6C
MNGNIENMLEELKEKYPDNWEDPIRGLDVSVYDTTNVGYEVDDDFVEELFYIIWINYKGCSLGISREDLSHNYFDIDTDTYIELEDLVELTKIMTIVVKHLSKINFKAHL